MQAESLRIYTSHANLWVDRVATYKSDATSRPLYRVCSQYDENLGFGSINLDENWRAHQPDHLEFIVLRACKEQGKVLITHLMCIQKVADERYNRVQVLRVQIDEEGWRRAKPLIGIPLTLF